LTLIGIELTLDKSECRISPIHLGRQLMRSWFGGWLIAGAVLIGIFLGAAMPAPGQATGYRAPRGADGKPNLNGIWQALNTANWDL
jgi:hypothetical protein